MPAERSSTNRMRSALLLPQVTARLAKTTIWGNSMVVWLSSATAYWHAAVALRRQDMPHKARRRSIRILCELAQQSDRVGDRARELLNTLNTCEPALRSDHGLN